MSQAYYPIKGLHVLLDAANILKQKYKDLKIYIGGYNPFELDSIKKALLQSEYQHYIRSMIKEYGLESHLVFLGEINAEQVKEYLLKSHVFVMPSTIENSPNSLSEAMLTGTPSVASCVGGIPSLVPSEEYGLLFESCNYKQLAEKIDLLFEHKDIAIKISQNAVNIMTARQDLEKSTQHALELYKKISFQKE